jgi:hypothetical protein
MIRRYLICITYHFTYISTDRKQELVYGQLCFSSFTQNLYSDNYSYRLTTIKSPIFKVAHDI